MKKGIHPSYGPAVIKCACGNTVRTQSNVSEINVEICSGCHPFYTGKKKIVDSTGRVDRFMKRFEKSKSMQTQKTKKKQVKETKNAKGKSTGKKKQ
ncbi:MAG: 50S ribosomal protein L31 [Candidatus Moranbacteria bacterium]|nr:50S ribosomal protein L31 [Candidatus Moranbacteria bacterium]